MHECANATAPDFGVASFGSEFEPQIVKIGLVERFAATGAKDVIHASYYFGKEG